MKDFASPAYQRKKVTANRVKVKKEPVDYGKYLRPLKKVLPVAGMILAVVTVICFGYKALSRVTFFSLDRIEVAQGERVSRDEILALAGVARGNDLLRLNLKRMGEQIAKNPWVETVHIRRFFPDGLSIAITERTPVAIVNMGYIYYLDARGNVFKVLNKGDRLDYPVVTGFSEDEMNSDPVGTREALQATCELLRVLQEKGGFIMADISEIHYDKGYGFTLFTVSDALTVKVGSGDFAAKVERLSRIYQTLMAQRPAIQYIDLDYSDRIIVKKS